MLNNQKVKIKSLKSPLKYKAAILLLAKMYPDYDLIQVKAIFYSMLKNNNKFIYAKFDKKLIAIGAYWISHRFHCGKYIQIDSIYVEKQYRNQEIATQMLDYVKNIGIKNNCEYYVLDVFVENHQAQKLYQIKGFKHSGYHLMNEL